MEKRRLFLFLFVLWINVSLQTSAANKLEESQNDTEVIILNESVINYLESRLSTVVFPVIYTLLILFGIPANAAMWFVLFYKIREKPSAFLYSNMRKESLNILNCSLVVSDLFLLLSVAFRVDYHLRGNNWVHGEAACRAVTACFYGSVYASAVTLAFISINNSQGIIRPLNYFCLYNKTVTVLTILGVWVMFVVAIVPELAVKQSYHVSDLDITTCHDVSANDDGFYNFLVPYNLVLIVLFLLVPLVVNVVCCTRVIYELNRTKLNSEEKTTFRVIVLTLIIFLLCFTPTVVLNLIRYVQVSVSNDDSLFVGFNVAVCLCCLHACVDPLLYIFRSESTRSILKDKLLKGKTSTICLRKN